MNVNSESEKPCDESRKNDSSIECSPPKVKNIRTEITSNTSQFKSNSTDEDCEWRGVELHRLKSTSTPEFSPPVHPSESHAVLFKVPVKYIPEPHPEKLVDVWDRDNVRMPHSVHSLSPVSKTELKSRWDLILQAYARPITSSQQLEAAILKYNSKYAEKWNFETLHYFFSTTLQEEEAEYFFSNLMPGIVDLALALPELITGPLPLLRKHRTRSVTLSQKQIASLLANAFLCTFPRRNTAKSLSEYNTFPDINFNRLFSFSAYGDNVQEKLKCLINYFRRVCSKCPDGAVTYSRHYIPSNQLPLWSKSTALFTLLHVSSAGSIEDDGNGMLELDFANKFIGGGVLGRGCVQEEIRFVICPELIVSRLFTECLDDTEALIITGVERYNRYTGYGSTFTWAGDFVDKTPKDRYGRRNCVLVAIDAFNFHRASKQYTSQSINRELNKAYAGFSWGMSTNRDENTSIATGNWGCGAFGGDVQLKALLQLMAAAHTRRNVAYFTFGDTELKDKLADIHKLLVNEKVTVGSLWRLLCQYQNSKESIKADLYTYLYNTVNKSSELSNFGFKPKTTNKNSIEDVAKKSGLQMSTDDIDATLAALEEDELINSESQFQEDSQLSEAQEVEKESVTKGEPMEVKSYSVKSKEGHDLCVRRQRDSWTRIEETKKDFAATEIVDDDSRSSDKNKGEIKFSDFKQNKKSPAVKRKISDYFIASSNS